MKRIPIAILVVLALWAAHLWADSEESYGEQDIFDLIMGIIENPDPIPQCDWIPLDAEPDSPQTSRTGERDDGRPAFEFDRIKAEPFLIWAYDVGTDHDIAFNAWHKNDWDRRIEFITSSTVDDVDPRLYVDSHNYLHVTWWEDDPASRVMVASRSGNGWGAPIHVDSGRRPSVAMWDGALVVAYERDNAHAAGQEIVFARSLMGTYGPFVSKVVAVTTRTERLDPIVHVRSGVLWIDWKDADNVIAVSLYQDDEWKMRMGKAWTDSSWVGELTVRHLIELELTGH